MQAQIIRSSFVRYLSLGIGLTLAASCTSAAKKDGSFEQEAFVLGSLHGAMLNKPDYSLNEFLAAIDSFQPDLILTETRTDRPGAIEGSIDGGIEQSLIYAYGHVANVPVIPADASDTLNARSGKPAKKPTAKQSALLKKRVAPFVANYRASVQNDDFFKLHGSDVQANIRKMYGTYERAGLDQTRTRLETICSNIKASLRASKSKRILIVFGIERKYALDDCLQKFGTELIPANDFVDKQKLAAFVSPETLKTQAASNMRASRMLLEQNLAQGLYRGNMKKQMEEKLVDFSKWSEAVSQLR